MGETIMQYTPRFMGRGMPRAEMAELLEKLTSPDNATLWLLGGVQSFDLDGRWGPFAVVVRETGPGDFAAVFCLPDEKQRTLAEAERAGHPG
jgi:hypothetical protein